MTKFCPKCQSETENNNSGKCKSCAKYYAAKWYQANRERIIEAAKAWQKANPERTKSTAAEYYAANSEHKKAYSKAWKENNKDQKNASALNWRNLNSDKIKEYQFTYRINNFDRIKESTRAWHKSNPEAKRINEQNRRARKRESGGILSKGLAKKLFELQKGKCPCCQQPLGDDYHLDHIVPLALGGSNTDDNIQLLRQQCNSQKHSKHPIDFMQSRGFLL